MNPDHIMNSNGAVFLVSLFANFAITQQLAASVGVSVALLILGKLLDYFVKPMVDSWFASRQTKKGRTK